MLRLKQCCCFPLKTGSLIIGYLHLVLNSLTIMACLTSYLVICSKNRNENELLVLPENWYTHLVIGMSISTAGIIMTVLMVYGVHKNEPKLMLPYLVVKFVALVLLSIFAVILFFGAIVIVFRNNTDDIWLTFVVGIFIAPLSICMGWYLYSVVYNFYNSLTEGPKHVKLENPKKHLMAV